MWKMVDYRLCQPGRKSSCQLVLLVLLTSWCCLALVIRNTWRNMEWASHRIATISCFPVYLYLNWLLKEAIILVHKKWGIVALHMQNTKKHVLQLVRTTRDQFHLLAKNLTKRLFSTFSQIKAVVDLPVGDNLQDHPMVLPFFYSLEQPVAFSIQRALSLLELAKHKLLGKGKIPFHFNKWRDITLLPVVHHPLHIYISPLLLENTKPAMFCFCASCRVAGVPGCRCDGVLQK